MPRTKVKRNLKNYRESENSYKKIREFKNTFDIYRAAMDNNIKTTVAEWDGELDLMRQRTSAKLLKMKMGDLLKINLNALEDTPLREPVHVIAMQSNNFVSVNDEGYLTEDASRPCSFDSAASAKSSTVSQQQDKHIFRTPKPLNSIHARDPMRSRSACGECSTSIAMKHGARNNMLSNHIRIHSAERKREICPQGQSVSPPAAFMRWPKPEEMVVSKYDSPIIAQVLPDKAANVHIPLRDGVVSLRPKKLDEVQADILEDLDPQTLSELRILHGNLEKIVNMADEISK
ncbi:borealin-like [Glossina fuscipes fuscipes]